MPFAFIITIIVASLIANGAPWGREWEMLGLSGDKNKYYRKQNDWALTRKCNFKDKSYVTVFNQLYIVQCVYFLFDLQIAIFFKNTPPKPIFFHLKVIISIQKKPSSSP